MNKLNKRQLEVGKTYFMYHVEVVNKWNNLKNCVGVFSFRVISIDHRSNDMEVGNILGGTWNQTMIYNQNYTINKYHGIYFENEIDAQNAFDNELIELAKNFTAGIRDRAYKKLTRPENLPKHSTLEVNSRKWITTLTKKELEYLDWIKDNL